MRCLVLVVLILVLLSMCARTASTADNPHNADVGGATDYRTYAARSFRLEIPTTWQQVPGTHGLAFAAREGFQNGLLTVGLDLGVVSAQSRDLQSDTDALVAFIRLANVRLTVIRTEPATLASRRALVTTLSNVSALTGAPETVRLITAYSNTSEMFFLATIAPSGSAAAYAAIFERIVRSVRFAK